MPTMVRVCGKWKRTEGPIKRLDIHEPRRAAYISLRFEKGSCTKENIKLKTRFETALI